MVGFFPPGQVVKSRAGRDRDKLYIVIGYETSSGYLFLADGENRRVEKPKRKNPQHLNRLNTVFEDIKARKKGDRLSNQDIKERLHQVREKDHDNKEV